MHSNIVSSSSRLSFLLGTVVLGDMAAAVCTNWTQQRSLIDDSSGFSNRYPIPVDVLVCPYNATKDCYFDPKSYSITDERDLTVTSNAKPLGLSDEETDAIFKLAQDGFNNVYYTHKPQEFITRNGAVTTLTEPPKSILLQVEPGMNVTLIWLSYHLYSTGTLSGCSNETLNDMTVTATAPYLWVDKNQDNHTVLAGGWFTSEDEAANSTDSGKSGVASLQTSTGSVVGLFMVALCFMML